MTNIQLKQYVQNEIANARIEAALKSIMQWSKDNGERDLNTQVILLTAQYNNLQRESNLGILSRDDETLNRNRLVSSLLNIVNDLVSEEPINEALPTNSPSKIVRSVSESGASTSTSTSEKFKVLMLTANPAGTRPLSLTTEFGAISTKLQTSTELIDLALVGAVNIMEFKEFTEKKKPHLLHFSGHGEEGDNGGIRLQNEDKNDNELVPIQNFRLLFQYFKRNEVNLKGILLNACSTELLAQELSKEELYVIGTTTEIEDDEAIAFSSGFYFKLVESSFNFERAFDSGRIAAAFKGADMSYFVIYKDGKKLEI